MRGKVTSAKWQIRQPKGLVLSQKHWEKKKNKQNWHNFDKALENSQNL